MTTPSNAISTRSIYLQLFGGDKTEPDGRFDEARNLLNPLRKNVAKVQDELKKNQKYLRGNVLIFKCVDYLKP